MNDNTAIMYAIIFLLVGVLVLLHLSIRKFILWREDKYRMKISKWIDEMAKMETPETVVPIDTDSERLEQLHEQFRSSDESTEPAEQEDGSNRNLNFEFEEWVPETDEEAEGYVEYTKEKDYESYRDSLTTKQQKEVEEIPRSIPRMDRPEPELGRDVPAPKTSHKQKED